MQIIVAMTSLNKAAEVLGRKGGQTTGQSKSRSAQLKAWWSVAPVHIRKARLERMAQARRDKVKLRVETC